MQCSPWIIQQTLPQSGHQAQELEIMFMPLFLWMSLYTSTCSPQLSDSLACRYLVWSACCSCHLLILYFLPKELRRNSRGESIFLTFLLFRSFCSLFISLCYCSSEFGDGPSKAPSAPSAVGGLSVTGCLSDFSVYIFHPYGGKKTGECLQDFGET